RQEWTSFIPGAHPGHITLDQWEANTAKLAAGAAAHGRDRTAGPPREGTALLQGIILCGRCGNRMTVRYHTRGSKQAPTYACQRDGIDNARPICAAIPGCTLDEHIGQLLTGTLTPLAVEAALQVSAELRQRAADADALRAAHVERARYHADLARRRYLAVDPGNRLVAGTLEADWNTALRALGDAQAAHDKAREQHAGTLTPAQKDRIAQLVTDLPGIWNDPATPMRERKRTARLLLTDVTVTRTSDTITAHVRLAGGQHRTLTLPVPEPAWKIRQTPAATIAEIDRLPGSCTCAEIAGILRRRGLPNGEGRPFTPVMVQRVIRTYQLPSRRQRLTDAGLIPLSQMARRLGVSTATVKDWYHAGIVSGQRYNDKGEVLYHPPGPHPPARHQGRRHHTQRPA
ncbi:MAG: zinc ribbon domain-containing protein, partial [Streptosporangiaceae bacterium]